MKTLYDFLKIRERATFGTLWNSWTDEQKREVLLAYDESENENNLIEREKVFPKSK